MVAGGLQASGTAAHGEVHVSSRVVGFKKIKFYTNENIGSGELDLPEQQMHTTAYWLTVPQAVMAALPYAPDDRRDGVVGLSFAMRQVAQLLLMCDRQDIGHLDWQRRNGVRSMTPGPSYPEEPRIFIYDNYPGGIGFSEPLFGMHADLLARTRELIAGCECAHGCPTCVGPVGNTGPLAKLVALRILDLLVAQAVGRMSTLSERLRGVIRPGGSASQEPALRRLTATTVRRPGSADVQADPAHDVADTLGGEWCDGAGHRYLVVDRKYPPGYRHGHVSVADALPPSEGAWDTLDLLLGGPSPLRTPGLHRPRNDGTGGRCRHLRVSRRVRLVRRRDVSHAPVLSLELRG